MIEPISVIVPVRNGERRLPYLLESIRRQSYDQTLIDIIVVDDASEDNTASIARAYGARVVPNGTLNIDRGKALGVAAAEHDLVLFLDDDNVLPAESWLADSVNAFTAVLLAAGGQPAWFQYEHEDPAPNRYQSLYGGTDPILSYLGYRDRLEWFQRTWNLAGSLVLEDAAAWIVRFDERAAPTLGSQGFITRRSILNRIPLGELYLHSDVCRELMRAGQDIFVMFKSSIIHNHCSAYGDMLRKIRRNMEWYFRDNTRRDRYETSIYRRLRAGLTLALGVGPLVKAARIWAISRDGAALMHPIICWSALALFVYELGRHRVKLVWRAIGAEKPA